ncbi:MAG TPA: glycerol kinase GlpK [Firmicutes bacterium]|jgi:glycerol kinase|nr:MAG: glycerol kinase [Peptococcaceae bacterium 1109]HHT72369.1 glycerol kinase GlpK [Bacillota bacterium]
MRVEDNFILAIDQGTTGNTVMLFDAWGKVKGRVYKEFTQHYPRPGWVEHDAEEIWRDCCALLDEIVAQTGIKPQQIAGIGITNQRETVVLWDRATGKPVAPAIVWQCRRTAPLCDELRERGLAPVFRAKTGLVLDAYFSGTKLKWLLDSDPHLRARAARGELAFGTMDSWLIYNLTGGEVHVTDYSNASRTLLFNIEELKWDQELLEILDIPPAVLPEVRSSSEVYGRTAAIGCFPAGIPVAGAAGDQQAALFGQACFSPGMVKATFGTGAFILMNTGENLVSSERGLLTTIAWGLQGKVEYALEGSVFVAGAAVQWLRDELKIIEKSSETEGLALSVPTTNGVYLVPAFVGLGAPYWDPYARGTILGMTRGTNRAHIVRAALESIVYQTRDVVELMAEDAALPIVEMKVDGGASVNNFICQFLADQTSTRVCRPETFETTALGAAYLAGLAVGLWPDQQAIADNWRCDQEYQPAGDRVRQTVLYRGWKRAVERSRGWDIHDQD